MVIAGDKAVGKRGKGVLFDMRELGLLNADDVTPGDKVSEGLVNKLLASNTRGIRAVVGKAMGVERANTGVEGDGVGEGGNIGRARKDTSGLG